MWPVLCWWVVLELIGVATLPLLFPLFSPSAAHGYPFAKIVGLLLITYLTWLAAYVIPLPTALMIVTGALAVAGALAAWMQRAAMSEWLRTGGVGVIARHAGLWTTGFLIFVWLRSMAPEIFGAEKYMDFAFLNLLSRTDSMPPQDPWMTGETINYYYFGYLAFANLVRIVPLPSYVSYNLCIATVGGSAFALTAAVVVQITQRWALAPLGGAMSALLGNLDGCLQFFAKGTLRGMDYWRSSRVVANGDTINEFPFFSTIHGDLHPHFIVLPVGITFLALLLDDRWNGPQEERRGLSIAVHALIAFVLGSMIAISPWELPAAAVVSFLLLGRSQPLSPLFARPRLQLIARLVAIFAVAYVLFLPFYREFAAPPGGVGWKVASSSLGEFLTVFGGLLFVPIVLIIARAWPVIPFTPESRQLMIAAAGLAVLIAAVAGNGVLPFLSIVLAGALVAAYASDDADDRRGFLLLAAAAIPLLACELVFIKDAYGDKLYRMNTVFKLYFQAWTMLAIAAPWSVHRLVKQSWSWRPFPQTVLSGLALLLAASACYPLGILSDRVSRSLTLDGNAYLRREHPDDFAALDWLRHNAQLDDVLLEATGNPYSYFARFSSNTGNPTILGWANHEGLWRGHDQDVMRRHGEIGRIYNSGSLSEARPLLDQYKVHWIIVGDLEHETYKPEGLKKFSELQVAFNSGKTTVYRYQ
jgi:YYY domain-containing protein